MRKVIKKLSSVFALFLLVALYGCHISINKATTTNSQNTTTTTTQSSTTNQTTTTTLPVTTTTEQTTTTTADEIANYYAPAMGLTGEQLREALHNIIENHTELSKSQLWDALSVTDRDPNNPNNVIEIYTGNSIPASDHGGDLGQWNREHVWAKSHGDFGYNMGPGTDLFNLHAADVQTNSLRSNLDFDDGGTTVKSCSLCKMDSDSFEPRDDIKGDVARTLFYMAVCYDADNGYDGVDLQLNDKVNNGTDPFMGKLSVLLQWNEEDPVDSFEINRNNVIYDQFQHNRNPFIDHPEWAELIWGQPQN